MLQLDTCTLHTIHLAFSSANKDSKWSLSKLYRVLWYLFHGSARREDFPCIAKSNVFMLQFCFSRWVEDILVAERGVEIWPNVVKYVNETFKKTQKHIPTVALFHTVHEYTKDPLVLTKL